MFGVQWPQSLSKLKSMTCARCALRLSNAAVCETFQSIYRLLTDPSMSGAMADQNMKVEVLSTLAECRASLHVAHRALCAVEKLAWKMFGLDPSQQPRPTRSLSGDEDHEQFRQKRRRVQEDDVETFVLGNEQGEEENPAPPEVSASDSLAFAETIAYCCLSSYMLHKHADVHHTSTTQVSLAKCLCFLAMLCSVACGWNGFITLC